MNKSRLPGAICVGIIYVGFLTASRASGVSGQGSWETTLKARDLDGNPATAEAYYDTVLDITWVRDANLALTNQFGLTLSGDLFDTAPNTVGSAGRMTWYNASAWIAGMNAANYGGANQWRLPVTNPVDYFTSNDANYSYNGTYDRGYNVSAPGTGYAGSTASEMAYMSFHTLANLSLCDPLESSVMACAPIETGWGIVNTGPFENIQTSDYWSETDYLPVANSAWMFSFRFGDQDGVFKTVTRFAWAVHPGDVGAQTDVDGDGVPDEADNCSLVANAGQQDADNDGHGNTCDADFDNDCVVSSPDLAIFKAGFFGTDPELDLDSDGSVTGQDLGIFKSLFFGVPGPSAPGSLCSP